MGEGVLIRTEFGDKGLLYLYETTINVPRLNYPTLKGILYIVGGVLLVVFSVIVMTNMEGLHPDLNIQTIFIILGACIIVTTALFILDCLTKPVPAYKLCWGDKYYTIIKTTDEQDKIAIREAKEKFINQMKREFTNSESEKTRLKHLIED